MFPKYSSCYIINTFVNILLFIIWPFGGFFYNLLRPVSRLTYVFFVFFFFLAGLSFSFVDSSVDSYRYAEEFVEMANFDISTGFLRQLMIVERIDFYYVSVALFLSRISDNPHLLFGLFGCVYGFLFCKLYVFLKKDWKTRFNFYVWVVFFVIFVCNPHSNLNAVRFFTAASLFEVALLSYVYCKKTVWILGIVLSPFVHSSFVVYVCIFLISYLIKIDNRVIFIICIFAFLFSFLGINSLLVGLIPDNLSIFSRYQSYIDDASINEFSKMSSSKHFIHIIAPQYMYIICLFFFQSALKNLNVTIRRNIGCLLRICMCFFVFNLFFSFVPSMGRFNVVMLSVLCFVMYKYYSFYRNRKYSLYILALIPLGLIFAYDNCAIHKAVLDPIYIYGTLADIIQFGLFKCVPF